MEHPKRPPNRMNHTPMDGIRRPYAPKRQAPGRQPVFASVSAPNEQQALGIMEPSKKPLDSNGTAQKIAGGLNSFVAAYSRFSEKLVRSVANKVPNRLQSLNRRHYTSGLVGLLLVGSVCAGLAIHHAYQEQRYTLSNATKQLIGEPVASLDKQLGWDAKTKTYQYNPAAGKGIQNTGSQLAVGGSKYYGVNLASSAKKGQTYTDAQTKLSFSLVPQFGQLDGKHIGGHIVYPAGDGQVIYTLKDNGLKEDVVLTRPVDNETLSYKLELPKELQARLLSDGSIGIYSADPALFGNISYGGSADQALVAKARTKGKKTNLVFQIPAPVITETGKAVSAGKATFKLTGDQLTVAADNLRKLSYPISIDPSVIVQSANSFTSGNNEDGNSVISTSAVARSTLTGATISSGWNSAGTLASAQGATSSTIINGYLYVLGSPSSGNTIQFGKINSSTGNVGTLTAVSAGSPYDAREAQIVGYNGFLYVLGGINTANNTAYGKTTASGDITGWVTGPTLNTGRLDAAATAYNNHLYIAGGCSSQVLGCSGQTASLESSTINADGSISSWTTTGMTALPYAAYGLRMFATNNRLYVMQGRDNNGNYYTNTAYAAINTNGTVGAWATTTALPVASAFSGVTFANGYVYVAGGEAAGGAVSTAYTAPVYSGGTIGAFQTITNLPKVWSTTSSVAYGGQIYLSGGSSVALGSTGGSSYSDVISATISTAGVIGQFTTSATYDTTVNAVSQACAVAYNGYIYQIGGLSTAARTANIRYASVSSNGTVGTWANTTKSLTNARSGCAATVNAGYLYVTGGLNTAGNTYLSDVEYVKLGSGDITTAFTDSTGYGSVSGGSGGRQYPGLVVNAGYLYVVGGRNNNNSTSLSDILYAPLANDGSIGTWALASTSLPTGVALGATVSYGGYLYTLGGINSSTYLNTVKYTQFGANGNITGSWSNGPSLPQVRMGLTAYASKGYLYFAGGYDGVNLYNDVRYTPINSNGSLGASWTQTGSFTTGRFSPTLSASNDYLYVIGGCTSQAALTYDCGTNGTLNDVQYAPINNGGSGSGTAWSNTSSTSSKRVMSGSVAYNGFIYVLGGSASASSYTNGVVYAPINADGTLGTFVTANTYGGYLPGITFSTYNGYIYAVGGNNGGTPANGVQYALICTGSNAGVLGCSSTPGSLSNWSYTSNSANTGTSSSGGLVTGRFWAQATAYNGYMYVSGGCTGAAGLDTCSSITNTTEIAAINSDGTLGAWSVSTSSFTAARFDFVSLAYNGYLYIFGGCTGLSSGTCNAYGNDVQFAKLNGSSLAANSGCGTSWCYAPNFAVPRENLSVTAVNGYIYLMGGDTSGSTVLADVQFAPVIGGGTLGTWQTSSTALNTAVRGAGVTNYSGYIYLLGGCSVISAPSCSTGSLNNGQYMAPQTQSHVAHYSRLIDLGSTVNGLITGDPQITRYQFMGSGAQQPNGLSPLSLCWSNATNASPVLNTQSCGNGGFGSSVKAKGYGRYGFVSLTLDDSQSAMFPDSSPTTVSEMDVYFHAAPAQRLRGGQTGVNLDLNGNQQQTNSNTGLPLMQQLDTEGL